MEPTKKKETVLLISPRLFLALAFPQAKFVEDQLDANAYRLFEPIVRAQLQPGLRKINRVVTH